MVDIQRHSESSSRFHLWSVVDGERVGFKRRLEIGNVQLSKHFGGNLTVFISRGHKDHSVHEEKFERTVHTSRSLG